MLLADTCCFFLVIFEQSVILLIQLHRSSKSFCIHIQCGSLQQIAGIPCCMSSFWTLASCCRTCYCNSRLSTGSLMLEYQVTVFLLFSPYSLTCFFFFICTDYIISHSHVKGGIEAKELFHSYITHWIYDKRRALLDISKLDKV